MIWIGTSALRYRAGTVRMHMSMDNMCIVVGRKIEVILLTCDDCDACDRSEEIVFCAIARVEERVAEIEPEHVFIRSIRAFRDVFRNLYIRGGPAPVPVPTSYRICTDHDYAHDNFIAFRMWRRHRHAHMANGDDVLGRGPRLTHCLTDKQMMMMNTRGDSPVLPTSTVRVAG